MRRQGRGERGARGRGTAIGAGVMRGAKTGATMGAVKSEAMRGSGKRGRRRRSEEEGRADEGAGAAQGNGDEEGGDGGGARVARVAPPPSSRSRSGSCATGRMHPVGHASVAVRRGNRGVPSNFYVLRTMQRLRPLFSLVRSWRLSRLFCIYPGHKVFAAMTHLAVSPIRCSWVRKTKKVLTSSGFCC